MMIITTFENGIKKVRKGSSKRQLKRAHETGKCWAFCSYCITDVEKYAKSHQHTIQENNDE